MRKDTHDYKLRMSPEKFKLLREEAEELGVSINSLIKLKLADKLKRVEAQPKSI